MSEWKARKFWKAAAVEPASGGFRVTLDGKPVMTPGKQPLILPTRALADAVAAEWEAQGDVIDPLSMPLTRAANSAIDKVAPMRAEVIAELAGYGGSDLICYRATDPQPLIDRQAAAWDPLVDWAATHLQAPLVLTHGVMPVAQPDASLTRLTRHVAGLSDFGLAGLHDLVAISGSLVLALAVTEGRLTAAEAFAASRVDPLWQAEQWGEDEEEAEVEAIRRSAFLQADRFFGLCR